MVIVSDAQHPNSLFIQFLLLLPVIVTVFAE